VNLNACRRERARVRSGDACRRRGLFRKIDIMEVDDIISYHDVVAAEKATLQRV